MTRMILAAGVAALAITAPAASQDRGKRDRGDQVQRDRGDARAQRTERRAQRVDRADRRTQRVAGAQERRADRAAAREQRVQRADRVQERQVQRADRAPVQRIERQQQRVADRAAVRDLQAQRTDARSDRQLGWITARNEQRIERMENRQQAREIRALNNMRVIPVSTASSFIGEPVRVVSQQVQLQELPNRLQFVYADTPDYYYRYGDGYLYQVNRSDNLIMALLPLFGLGLTTGQPFPMAYNNYYLPSGLQPFYANSSCGYGFGETDYYRYVNGYVYEIDCRTGLVEDVDPLLGYGYGYGQMMPATYSAYNVPYQYRDLYYDSSDHYYRYAPGAIYQVDPTTSLVTAVAALLTGGMTVGQPLPAGYGVYNVPYAYRTNYYDTPDAWYRYSNGYIYQVDPATQLVTAVVASALT